jgi:hypothetical protein
VSDVARLAKEAQGALSLSTMLGDHREEVDALGLAGEVPIEVVTKSFRVIDAPREKLMEDVVSAFVELIDAAGADLVMRFG